jgi:hypothetical protein
MKIIYSIVLLVLVIPLFVLTSCSGGKKYCDPDSIRSGRSSQHHDTKKFRGMIRVKWKNTEGNLCLVKFENMKESFTKLYEGCDCDKYHTGYWVNIDSI